MKQVALFFMLICYVSVVRSQGVLEQLFYKLPAEYFFDHDLQKKKEVIGEMKGNSKNSYKEGSIIDEKNGYLRYVSYQCNYEMCYWLLKMNVSGEEKKVNIVAVIESCMDKPKFFIEDGEELKPYNFEVFNSFNAFFFFKDDARLGDIREYIDWFSFNLPQKGLNITAKYGGMYGDQEKKEWLKGDKIDFVWDNGKFKMGEPYF